MAELLAANQITIAKVLDGEKGADGEMSAEQIAQLNQASEDASQAKSDVANLEIGGRNYVVKTDSFSLTKNGITVDYDGDVYHVYGTNTKTDANYSVKAFIDRTNVFEPEAVYTVSTTTPLPSGLYLGINTRNSIGTEIRAASNSYFYGDGSKTSNTFTCIQDTNGELSGFFGVEANCGTVDVTFKIKLEKGNRATDWTPAPEDVDAGIANAQTSADNAQTSADNAQEDIDNLEIGGKNLVTNSKNLKNFKNENPSYISMIFTDTDVTVTGTKSVLGIYYDISVEGASYYTLSFNAANISGTCKYSVGGNDVSIWAGLYNYIILEEGRTEVTFKTNAATTVARIYFSCHSGSDSFRLWNVKLEKGNRATDWTPAPEDVQAEIDSIKKRVVIDDDSVDIVDSTGRLLASYGDANIKLGEYSVSSIIEMCGGMARVSARYGGLTTIYSNNGGYQTTLDYDFNESKFKSKVGSNYGSYEFIYSGGVWECSYSGNSAGYVQVSLSDYGITLKTTSVNEYAGITITYWDGSEATFINADTTKPSRKLILGLAESGTSDNADYANIEIERSKEGNVEHSKINLLAVHDGANVAGIHLDNGNIELNASGEVLINQYNIVQRLMDMLCGADTESITVTAGTFTNNGCSATLVGNTLYLYLNAKAKAAITAGNITNQTMLTITFTDDRILALYSASGSGGSSGPNSQMQFSATSSGGQHTITVALAAIAQNIAKDGVINAHISMPCVLNWDAF